MQLRFRLVWNKVTHRDKRARDLKGLARVIEDETAAGHLLTVWLDARALLKIGVVVVVAGWFSAAGGLWLWLDRDPFNRVGFADLACPWRWKEISDLRGQGYLDAGLEALNKRRINEALFAIRQGLARHPDAQAVRLALARLYARSSYYAGVREVMLPQLALTPPSREFVRFLLESAAQNDDHATMLAVCERVLAGSATAAADRGWLLEQKAAALIALEQPAAALAALDLAGRNRSADWRRLRMTALFDVGRAAEAVAEIRAWSADEQPEEFCLEILAEANRRAGRLEEMAAALRALQRLHPTVPEPWLKAIDLYVHAGWRDAAWDEVQDALRRFDADGTAVARIEQACVEAGAPDLVALCVDNARELARPLSIPLYNLTLAQLRAGDAAAAERTYERLLNEDGKARDRAARSGRGLTEFSLGAQGFGGGASSAAAGTPPAVRNFLRTLLDAVVQPASDRAEAHCGALSGGSLLLAAFVSSAEVFARFGHWPAVAAVARTGLTRFPGSTQLTRWGETAAGKIAALPSPQPAGPVVPVAVVRAPTRPIAPAVVAAPPSGPNYAEISQADFSAKLDDAMRRRSWAEANGLLHGVNTAAPPWRPHVEADLAWREVRIAFEQDDRPQLLFLIGQRLRTRNAEVSRALEFARWYREKREFETARLIAGKILQEVPGYVAGRSFLSELDKAAKTQILPAPPSVPK